MARKVHHRADLLKIAIRALEAGAAVRADNPSAIEWNAAGKCAAPVHRELRGYTAPTKWAKLATNLGDRLVVDIDVRCRKCAACLRARAAMWRNRAKAECDAAARTWFGTLTLAPGEQFKALSRARLRLAKQGSDFDTLPFAERLQWLVWEISPELTRYLKRVRKQSASKFRYIIVAEAHKSGQPHFHMLLHESDPGNPVPHRVLKSKWCLGFSDFKLVKSTKMAIYVTKYLSKSNAARVRASLHYGSVQEQFPSIEDNERRESVLMTQNPNVKLNDANKGF